jgi:hypothetical protein
LDCPLPKHSTPNESDEELETIPDDVTADETFSMETEEDTEACEEEPGDITSDEEADLMLG